jgi:vitamin B12 transporter
LIEWDQATPADKWKPTNLESARIKGIELALNFSTGSIEHSLAAEWTDAKDTKTNKKLTRRPEEKFSWGMSYQTGDFNTYLALLYTGDRYDRNDNNLESYTTVDLGLGYKATEALLLSLRVNNVLDESYITGTGNGSEPYYYYNGAERSILFTAKYAF